MKFRRKPRENVEINLASLLDVVFILLLFFVVSTTFTRETQMKVVLPEAASGAAVEEAAALEIEIAADGQISLNNQLLARSDLATLMTALQQASGGDNRKPLVVSADAKTPHQAVVIAMDAAGKLGFTQLRITTVEVTSP